MKLLDKPLQALTAEDLMSRTVLTISAEMSLRCAARLLTRERVTGAPVVNNMGQCVGVLSTTDFLKLVGVEGQREAFSSRMDCDWQMFAADDLPEESVRSLMTTDPVMVSRDTPLGELARRMVDAHIHRLIVDDGKGRPIGIVSSTDVLAAVAQLVSVEVES